MLTSPRHTFPAGAAAADGAAAANAANNGSTPANGDGPDPIGSQVCSELQ